MPKLLVLIFKTEIGERMTSNGVTAMAKQGPFSKEENEIPGVGN
jgi:hypothetical protein